MRRRPGCRMDADATPAASAVAGRASAKAKDAVNKLAVIARERKSVRVVMVSPVYNELFCGTKERLNCSCAWFGT